ncbi:uncharacterized protein LOC134829450 [Culicoides brevitarsis]|uniref:uncharacterized protein LOC134829450 n=1 Tax=Culicoides brevitarsis TaxID=469753 RepID=UPI00307B3252
MDDYVQEMLIRWNLPDLITRFREEQVNKLAFQYLNEEMIKELVPKVGRRAIFRHKYIEFKRKENKLFSLETTERTTSSSASEANNTTDVFVRVIDENDLVRQQGQFSTNDGSTPKRIKYDHVDLLQILNDGELKDDTTEEVVYEFEGGSSDESNLLLTTTQGTPELKLKSSEPSSPATTTIQFTEKLSESEQTKPAKDLRAVLQESVIGRSMLEKKTLTSSNRNQISDIIVQHLMNKSSDYRIRTVEFLYWANAIKLVFPYEVAETYYQPYKRDANTCARGKLFDKYHHVRRAFLPRSKRPGLKPLNNSASSEVTSGTTTTVIKGSKDIVTLKTTKNVAEFKELWTKTFDERQEILGKLSIIDYFDTFSVLKTYNGINLLKQDFDKNYAKSKEALTTKWPAIAKKILTFAKPKMQDIIEQLQDDDMDIENSDDHYLHYSFILLFYIMPAKKVIKVNNWIPSKLEMVQSCFLYAKTFGELQTKMTDRKAKLNKLSLPILPLIGAIGDSFGDLQRNFVIINNIFYEFPSLIDAVDACFKIFIALKAEYPPEGHNFWAFIQKFVYQIGNKSTMAINCLWSDLEALELTEKENNNENVSTTDEAENQE